MIYIDRDKLRDRINEIADIMLFTDGRTTQGRALLTERRRLEDLLIAASGWRLEGRMVVRA